MRKIQKLVERIDEELHDAEHYAECYVEYKAAGKTQWANRFQSMADDELKHAGFVQRTCRISGTKLTRTTLQRLRG